MKGPLLLWLALGLTFFGSLTGAAFLFPHPYDWQRTVISSLASPRDDPRGHLVAAAGLALSGLLLIPFELFLERRLGRHSPRWTKIAGRLFLMAAICLLLSALVAPGHYRILGIGRSHEHLAQVSGVAFCLSLLCYLIGIFRLPRSAAWIRAAALVLVALPVAALLFSRISLCLAYEFCSEAIYRAIRSSLWNSLALWEWVGAVCIYLFLGLLVLALPEIERNKARED